MDLNRINSCSAVTYIDVLKMHMFAGVFSGLLYVVNEFAALQRDRKALQNSKVGI